MLRGTIATILLLTAISAKVADAEETTITRTGRKAVAPIVGYGECEELCVFKSETEISRYNKWCFKGAAPAVRVGWEFGQRYAVSEI